MDKLKERSKFVSGPAQVHELTEDGCPNCGAGLENPYAFPKKHHTTGSDDPYTVEATCEKCGKRYGMNEVYQYMRWTKKIVGIFTHYQNKFNNWRN